MLEKKHINAAFVAFYISSITDDILTLVTFICFFSNMLSQMAFKITPDGKTITTIVHIYGLSLQLKYHLIYCLVQLKVNMISFLSSVYPQVN